MIHYREYLIFGLKLKKKKNRLEYISQILIYISPYSSRNLSGCHKVSVKKKAQDNCFRIGGEQKVKQTRESNVPAS